jgi:hypothetical protein
MIWAENVMTSDYTKFHTYYGFFFTQLNPDGSNILLVEGGDSVEPVNVVDLYHGIGMWLAWTIFGFVMISTNRWYSYKSDVSQYWHGAFGVIILGLTIGLVVAMIKTFELNILGSTHTILGWLTVLFAALVSIGGITTNLIKRFTKWNTPKVKQFRKMHKLGAIIVLLLSYTTLTYGLLRFILYHENYSNYKFLWPLNVGLVIFVVLT